MKASIWILVIVLYVLLILVGISFGSTSRIPDLSGWVQVFIEALGIPAIVYGLYRLIAELQKERWKPDIQIGLSRITSLAEIKQLSKPPNEVHIDQTYPLFMLVIRNSGKLAARYVKIHLEFTSFQDDSYKESAEGPDEMLSAPVLDIPDDSPFERKNNKDFIFQGDSGWMIYPRDNVAFTFILKTIVSGQPPIPHNYQCICTVWAEGLDDPNSRELTIWIQKSA